MTTLRENDIAVLNYIFDPNISWKYDINEQVEDNVAIDEEEPSTPEVVKAKELEVFGIKLAEEGKLAKALEIFSQAVKLAERPSGYNNRAQAHRLNGDEKKAMEDLEKALKLSGGKGRAGCQALNQRGIIYRKWKMDDKARTDFNEAALLGSSFAKKQLVEMNPYAAMCNQMMKQMLYPKNEL